MKIISNYLEASKSGQRDREREPEEKKFKEGKQSAPHQRHCGTGWYRATETIGNPTGAVWSRKQTMTAPARKWPRTAVRTKRGSI